MNPLRCFVLALAVGSILVACPARADDVVNLTVTRAELPKLTYYDLTLRVDAGGASKAAVLADGKAIDSRIENDRVIFTTAATNISVTLAGVTDKSKLGKVSKAALRDDKLWAWSVGFDDNAMFKSTAIPVMEKYGYRGTVFLIGEKLADKRNEGWIIDRPDIIRLVQSGWGIGNHTWTHIVVPAEKGKAAKYGTPDWAPTPADMTAAKEQVRKAYEYLRSACDEAGKKDYRLIAFAAPMFDGRWQPVIDDMRKNNECEVLFNESGNRYFVVVDPDWKPANQWVSPAKYTLTGSIGRDPMTEAFGSGSKDDPKDKLTKEIAKCGENYHLWYNTLCHGVGEKHGVLKFIPWVNDTYGKDANNTVWVAPSDEIYSYLLVRDNSTVTVK